MGCAGLSLAVHMIRSGRFGQQRILLIDREPKQLNDRTWCYWETDAGPFEEVVHRKWEKAWFHSDRFSELLDLHPYTYKMIRGIDYYAYCIDLIRRQPNFTILEAPVTGLTQQGDQVVVTTDRDSHTAPWVFNSILFEKPSLAPGTHYLLQHFQGWVIHTPQPAFRPEEATFMDFRPDQSAGTTFVYVMPLAADRALVEYTLFSPELLSQAAYDRGLSDYIQTHLGIDQFEIREREFGIIPMTNHRFPEQEGRILHLGTAGGQTKASSGFTFRFIQKHSAGIVAAILREGHPVRTRTRGSARFDWYDSVLLHILQHRILEGRLIFGRLFERNKPSTILRFLDNESHLLQDIRLMSSLPQWPFMKAGIRELFR